jgi:adenosylcobinamide kinase/adenosylcobinamide-phosphate guanylyltransferase
MTLWLSHRQMTEPREDVILAELEEAVRGIVPENPGLIIVSNELGLGLVPSSPEGRSFRDLTGRANQLAARLASRVEFMVAGLPMQLKGDKP